MTEKLKTADAPREGLATIGDLLRRFSGKEKKILVLDLACGEGSKMKYFSGSNFKVISIDKSKDMIKTALKKIPNRENTEFIIVDIKNAEFGKNIFDLIIAVGILHFLPKTDALNVISKMKRWTKRGGYNFISVFRGKDRQLAQKNGMHLFAEGEIKRKYSDWMIEYYKEFSFLDKIHDKPHVHEVFHIMARKR
ncbi:MAG: methyltransferase domain-containing protein [Candidatus Aenigmarchaeota archaeon]|nr:methyltransferase domain-containing protein [Candidatus Aenigmarchaeota archaeon]